MELSPLEEVFFERCLMRLDGDFSISAAVRESRMPEGEDHGSVT
jgi:hypothetical protein